MRTPLLALAALVLFVAFVPACPEALAHGGQYRGPGGGVTPGLRTPFDPPPPPPPPTPAPVTGGPETGPRGGPTTGGPTPMAPGSKPTTAGTGSGRPASPSLGLDNWVFWYAYNRASLQDLKRSIYTRFSSDSPLHVLGESTANRLDAAAHDTRALLDSDIVPALLWAMEPANAAHADVESAAYIALAKVTSDPTHLPLLLKGVERDPMTQESALLAMGLLRRSEQRRQFSAGDLDRVREALFSQYESERLPARARGFALVSIGLLGDQPSALGAPALIQRLFSLLEREEAHPDLFVAALVALGMQDREAFTLAQRETLRGALVRGRLGARSLTGFLRSYVALTLGRIGVPADVAALTRVLGDRRQRDHYVSRSAAISLGLLGQALSSEERADVARTLLRAVDRSRDLTTTGFALISLAYLVEQDARAARSEVISRTQAHAAVLKIAEDGGHGERTFAALSVGLMLRAIGPENLSAIAAYGEFRDQALPVLRAGLGSPAMDKRSRGAYAIALGLAEDRRGSGALIQIVADPKEDPELRGYSALGLGHMRHRTAQVLRTLREALAERSSEELRVHLSGALGMLSDPHAVPLLLAELEQSQSQAARGQVVLALASIGDARAVAPLIASLRAREEQVLARALACAGLGLVGDLEWQPSLARLSSNVNYRASGEMMSELLSIL